MSELLQIKSKKPPGFRQASLFRKILVLLECHQFRLGMRRFAIDLFDKSVMRQIVLDEESSEENVDSDDDDDAGEDRTARPQTVTHVSGSAPSE
jgi:rapamycin-insensitive companion of mTOR